MKERLSSIKLDKGETLSFTVKKGKDFDDKNNETTFENLEIERSKLSENLESLMESLSDIEDSQHSQIDEELEENLQKEKNDTVKKITESEIKIQEIDRKLKTLLGLKKETKKESVDELLDNLLKLKRELAGLSNILNNIKSNQTDSVIGKFRVRNKKEEMDITWRILETSKEIEKIEEKLKKVSIKD